MQTYPFQYCFYFAPELIPKSKFTPCLNPLPHPLHPPHSPPPPPVPPSSTSPCPPMEWKSTVALIIHEIHSSDMSTGISSGFSTAQLNSFIQVVIISIIIISINIIVIIIIIIILIIIIIIINIIIIIDIILPFFALKMYCKLLRYIIIYYETLLHCCIFGSVTSYEPFTSVSWFGWSVHHNFL